MSNPNPAHLRWLRKTWVVIRFCFYLIVGLYALAISLFTLFVALDRSDVVWIEFIKTGYALVLWPVLPLGLLVLMLRRWRILALFTPALIGGALYFTLYFMPHFTQAAPDAKTITVLTFNIYNGARYSDNIARVIADADADIVAVQEFGLESAQVLGTALALLYPYQALNPEEGMYNDFRGMGVFSRYPIISREYWKYEDLLPSSHGHQRVVIDINGTPITVYNVHPWPPVSWLGGITFEVNEIEAAAHQVTVQRLAERVFAEDSPVLMVGDFNMSDQFEEYRLLTSRLTDSFLEGGQGLGYTYPVNEVEILPPLMRLDYIFHNADFACLSARVLNQHDPSDHLPLLATLALKPKADSS